MVRWGINLIRNIHYDLHSEGEADQSKPQGLDSNSILLETTSEVLVPYLLLRRSDDVPAPHNPLVPIAHVYDLEYIIAEAGEEDADDELGPDIVERIRDLDAAFVERLRGGRLTGSGAGGDQTEAMFTGRRWTLLQTTSDVEEGVSEDRQAYILSRRVELAADVGVPLYNALEMAIELEEA